MPTVKELRATAQELGVDTKGMTKSALEEAIAEARSSTNRRAGVSTVAETMDAAAIVERKDGGESFAAIAEDLGVSLAVVMTAYVQETEGSIDATPEAVAAARAEGAGWRAIAARAGISKTAARALFDESGEEDPGRGRRTGRTVETEETEKPKKAAKKATSKKAPAKKATARKGRGKKAALPDWDEASEDDIRAALEGKTVTHKGGDVSVDEVLRFGTNKAKKRVVQVKTEDGAKANIVLETVTAAA